MKQNLSDQTKRFEETKIRAAIRRCDGNVSKAADQLGMSRQAMYRRIQRLETPLEDATGPIVGEDPEGRPIIEVVALPGSFEYGGARYLRLAYTCPVCAKQVIHDRRHGTWVGAADGPRDCLCGCWAQHGVVIKEIRPTSYGV